MKTYIGAESRKQYISIVHETRVGCGSAVAASAEFVELVEGRARLLLYNPDRYRRPDGVYEPSWSPVFYNPVMVFNRDFSVLAAASLGLSGAIVLDALSGTGVRALRYCLEVPGVVKCYASDIDSRAYELIAKNISRNNLESKVVALNEDANIVMYSLKRSGERLDLVDIDPYGSPAPFLRAASWSVRNGGYIGATATDVASLSGSKPWAGTRRYWCCLTPTDVPRILALRVLIGYAARVAAEIDRYVEPIAYLVGNYFIRILYRVRKGAAAADAMLSKSLGYMKYCRYCGYREFVHEIDRKDCKICGNRLEYLGPLWVDRLVDKESVERAKSALPSYSYMASASKLSKVLELQSLEADGGVLLPYNVVQMSSRIRISSPKVSEVIECLRAAGYFAIRYYGENTVIGTNAPYDSLVACLRRNTL